MKVGVIGCGGMGTTHYQALKALSAQMDLEVTALADCREELLAKASKCFPNAEIYTEGLEMIEKEALDIVHICLPSYLHVSYAVAAMEMGINVFVEKPVCLKEEEAACMLVAERTTGVRVMVGQVVRSFDEYRYLKKVYDNKLYGNLKSVVMTRISGRVTWGFDDWFQDEEKSGSAVLDLHVHDLDFLRYMLGEPDDFDVKATAYENGMINQIITSYEFGNVFAIAEGIWDESPAVPFQVGFRACFEDATLIYNSMNTPSLTVYKKDGAAEVPDLNSEYNVESESAGINISNLGPYYTEIKYFAECVRDERDIEVAPLCEGVKSVRLAVREWEAAKEYVKKHR